MEKEFTISGLPPFLKHDVEIEHAQLLEAGTVKEGDAHFFDHLSENLKLRLTEHAVTLGKPQVHNSGDEFLPENDDGEPTRTESHSAEEVQSIRMAFTRESHRYGNPAPKEHVPTDRREAEGQPKQSQADTVREAFTFRKASGEVPE